MTFKSEAQKRKFAELVKQGKITQSVFDAFHVEGAKLPERVKKAVKVKKYPNKVKVIK